MPTLPLELEQLVISHALSDPPSPLRQRTLHALQLVSKAWFSSIPRWHSLDLFNFPQLVALNRALLNRRLVGDARLAVRNIRIRLPDAVTDERASQKVSVLLSLVAGVEGVEFSVAREGLVRGGGREGSDSLGHGVRTGLYQNTKLKRLGLSGLSAGNKIDISASLFDS